jgi:hypothetical protein
MILSDFLELLSGVKPRRNVPGAYMAKCPAHADSTASLCLTTDGNGDRILLKCMAGCNYKSILAAMGLGDEALFTKKKEKEEKEKSQIEIQKKKQEEWEKLVNNFSL